jgi:glycosyltransferase involved in cell wall biosynthesis
MTEPTAKPTGQRPTGANPSGQRSSRSKPTEQKSDGSRNPNQRRRWQRRPNPRPAQNRDQKPDIYGKNKKIDHPLLKKLGMCSIIVPVYNEEISITPVISDIKKHLNEYNLRYEIIVVNDGSTDNTAIEAAKHERVRIVTHRLRRGYGRALKSGIENAQGNVIVIIDGDRSYPAGKIVNLLEDLVDYDMAVGARRGKIPRVRRPAKWVLNKLANFLSGVKIPDLNSGLRAFRKELINEFLWILPDGFSFTTTITLALLCNGYEIKYRTIEYNARSGKSKIHPIKDTSGIFMLILRTIIYFNPLKVFMPLGMFFCLTGVVVGLGSFFLLDKIMDVTTVLLIVTGIQIMATGLLADAVARKPR